MDQLNASAWIGRTEQAFGGVTEAMAAMLHVTTTQSTQAAPRNGDMLPQLWHWAAFNDAVPLADLALDGHPKLGGFLPPIALERRMWAGGALSFCQPLYIGEPLTRTSKITNVVEKNGAAGPMVFVTVAHEISGSNGLAIRESQDIVYLQIPAEFSPPKPVPAFSNPRIETEFPVSEALLFRYSALTFNAHRIHYDLPYATKVEKYPGLIVHGPLQATLLMELATQTKGSPPTSFKFRGVHPMFHFEDLVLQVAAKDTADASINDASLSLCTASRRGHQGLQASVHWEEAP